MSSTPPNRDINTMLENLTITTKDIHIYHTQQKISTDFEEKIFAAIKYIGDRKQWPDVDAIFKYIAKNEASNISEDFIEDNMTKLLKEDKVINKKASEGLGSFYSNIKNQEHVLETPIAKKKSKPPSISIPIINENIETPILKNTESNPPILKISNFQKLEAQLSSIKSSIKCEISNLTQQIGSVKQNVYETLKDIEQRVKNTKILKDHLLFLQNELSSKNEIIKSLMDTQSAALKAVTSHTPNDGIHAKNSYNYRQENQKIIEEPEIVPKKFCTEEVQSKQKINQQKLKLKTTYVGNLDENISEEDLHELFGLKSTKYLQETCKVEVIRDKRNGVSKFAYVTASDHVSKELLKLNDETFKERSLTIEEAKKLPNSPVHSPTKTRSSVVINCHPENQTTFQNKCTSQNNLPIAPGKQTYKNAAVQKKKLPAKTLILSHSIAPGIKICEFNKYIKYD